MFVKFAAQNPGCIQVRLTRNYRSTQTVIQASEAILGKSALEQPQSSAHGVGTSCRVRPRVAGGFRIVAGPVPGRHWPMSLRDHDRFGSLTPLNPCKGG